MDPDPEPNLHFHDIEEPCVIFSPCRIQTHISIFDTGEENYLDLRYKFLNSIRDYRKELKDCMVQMNRCKSFYSNYDVWSEECRVEMEHMFTKLNTAAITIRKEGNDAVTDDLNIDVWEYFLKVSKELIRKANKYLESWSNFDEIELFHGNYARNLDSKYIKIIHDWRKLQRLFPFDTQNNLNYMTLGLQMLRIKVDNICFEYLQYVPNMRRIENYMTAMKNSHDQLIEARNDFQDLLKQFNVNQLLSDEESNEKTD